MRMRMLVILLTVLAIGTIGLTAGVTRSDTSAHESTETARKFAPLMGVERQQSSVAVDGSVNPEKIPDHLAYLLFFRMVSGRQTEAEKRHILSYLRQIGLDEADSSALITAAEEFRQRIGVLDDQASQIVFNPPSDKKQLKELDKQKEAITKQVVASLRHRLSNDGLEKVRQHVKGRVKRNIKIVAPHPSAPTG